MSANGDHAYLFVGLPFGVNGWKRVYLCFSSLVLWHTHAYLTIILTTKNDALRVLSQAIQHFARIYFHKSIGQYLGRFLACQTPKNAKEIFTFELYRGMNKLLHCSTVSRVKAVRMEI